MEDYSENNIDNRTRIDGEKRYWHAYSNGKDAPVLFRTDDDYRFAMNVIAQAAYEIPGQSIIAFEVMSNHFHFVQMTHEPAFIEEFFAFIQKRLSRFIPAVKKITLSIKPIKDRETLRNTIVYVNRNGYVADRNFTPFSYPWGTGRYYFHNFPLNGTYGKLTYRGKRLFFRGREPELPEEWGMIDGYIAPTAYCALDAGMSMFRNPHHYYSKLNKNVESLASIAVEIEDNEFLSDQEVLDRLFVILKEEYNQALLQDLTKMQKLDLARRLRNSFRSSNEQIVRVLNLTRFDVDSLFPLNSLKK